MTDMEIKEKIELMELRGYSIDDMAEEIGTFKCVTDFTERPKWCGENNNCSDCWKKCIEIELNKQEM